MSSNIKIERICEWCGNKFMAQTTVTRFCSKRCSEHAYKERLRQQKIQITQSVPTPNLSAIKAKEYIITNGTDIYTVSKMLTHKSVATTQIYADVVNQKKRAAANSISLK